MKKFLSIILIIICCVTMIACSSGGDDSSNNGGNVNVDNSGNSNGDNTNNDNNNNDDNVPVEPIYGDELVFDETGHWYPQLNGDGKKDFAEHDNDRGKCYFCDYFFETDDVEYELRYNIVDDKYEFYYVATKYLKDNYEPDIYIEIPVMHQEPIPEYEPEKYDEDEELLAEYEEYYEIISTYAEEKPYPVLEIGEKAFTSSGIEAIKLNEGLKKIGGSAFTSTFIREIIIPNSVEGKLYNICGGCVVLKNAVIGDGITLMDGYIFSGCTALRTVTIGKNVKEIQRRAFYDCDNIQYLIMPKSVVSIPESQIYADATKKYVTMNNIFQGGNAPARGIYFEITEDEYNALILPLMPRDAETGSPINPDTGEIIPFKYTTYGYVSGWCDDAKLYFAGEWYYDDNGEPVPY